MSVPLGEIEAIKFDIDRGLYGPKGTLRFLRFKGAGQYDLLFEVRDGWKAVSKKKEEVDTAPYLEISIAENRNVTRNNTVSTLLRAVLSDSDGRVTDVGIGGVAYKIIKDHVYPPVKEPLMWTVRVYLSQGQVIVE